MSSINDTTILAMLSRFPDMSTAEADGYIAKIEHEENVPICHAVLGRISESDLETEDARKTFREFQAWSRNRTIRTRDEQWSARRRQKETKLALKLNHLHQKGVISDQVLLMYGISGDLPQYDTYAAMNAEQKNRIWVERMESRFGPDWNTLLAGGTITFVNEFDSSESNWLQEGF